MGDSNLFDGLAHLHQLCRPGFRMAFQLAPLGPAVGVVVVADIAQQQATVGPMDDEPEIPTGSHRPEIRVTGPVELVKFHAGVGRIELKIESRGLNGLLLVAC